MTADCLDHEVVVSFGSGKNLGQTKKTETMSIRQLHAKLSVAPVDNSVTFEEYAALDKDGQGARKREPGWLFAGKFDSKNRKGDSLKVRSMAQIDIDHASPVAIEDILEGLAPIRDFCFIWHTTRSHAPEKPRLRLLVPFEKPVGPKAGAAITRYLAALLDLDPKVGIELADKQCFKPNQIMFLPSVSLGQEYLHGVNEAPILDVKAFLADRPGWQEKSNLPHQAGENRDGHTPAKKAEDPTEKIGIVGAFCRAYPVEDAIAEFIPGVYVENDNHGDDRYTYAAGSGTGGCIVYDDGKFFFSHHESDPAEGQNNAFDLVRKHLFGEQDKGTHGNTTPSNVPSFKAMVEMLKDDEKVQAELSAAFEFDDDDFDDLDEDEEVDLLDMTPLKPKNEKPKKGDRPRINPKTGKVIKTFENLVRILKTDPRIAPCIGFNVLRQTVCARREIGGTIPMAPVPDKVSGRPWQDPDTGALRVLLSKSREDKGYETEFSHTDVDKAVTAVALSNPYHPFIDLASQEEWDGVDRIDTAFVRHLKCEDLAYVREAARAFFLATICRQFEPGAPFHLVPILSGDEGGGKTGFFKAIAFNSKFYGELHSDFSNIQKMVESTQGKVIAEIPELKGFRRNEHSDLKQYFTSEFDTVRLSYDRRSADYPRFCTYAGTTNEAQYLLDGDNRRFLPIPTPLSEKRGNQVDFAELEAEVPQLWAEALHKYRAKREAQPKGALFFGLESDEAKAQAWAAREEATEEQPWEVVRAAIQPWLNQPLSRSAIEAGDDQGDEFEGDMNQMMVRNAVQVSTILERFGGEPVLRGIIAKDRMIARALREMGWKQHRARLKGPLVRWYFRNLGIQEEFIPVEPSPGAVADPEIEEMLG